MIAGLVCNKKEMRKNKILKVCLELWHIINHFYYGAAVVIFCCLAKIQHNAAH